MKALMLILYVMACAEVCSAQEIREVKGESLQLSKYLASRQSRHKVMYYAIISRSGLTMLDPIADAQLIARYFSPAGDGQGIHKIFLESPDQINEFLDSPDSLLVYGHGHFQPFATRRSYRLQSIPILYNFSLYNQSNYPYYTGIRSIRGGVANISFLLEPRDSVGSTFRKLLFLEK